MKRFLKFYNWNRACKRSVLLSLQRALWSTTQGNKT